MEEFDPHRYTSYEELPEEQKSNFKAVEGGFVRKTAEENIAKAFEEAHIERNVIELDELSQKKKRDVEITVEILGGQSDVSLVGMTGRSTRSIEELRTLYQGELQKLERHNALTHDIIRRYRIHEFIDEEFLTDVAVFLDLYNTDEAPKDEAFFANEAQYVQEARSRLARRQAKRRYERGGEERLSSSISGNRKITIAVSEQKDNARIEFTPFTDYEKTEIGPGAVDIILGGKFTAEDYENISNILLQAKGAMGDACRKYAEAVRKWAELENANQNSDKARGDRRAAALELMEAFPQGGPMTDIPLNAIFYTVIKKFPSFANTRIPQPFES